MKTEIDFVPFKEFKISSTNKGEARRDLNWLLKKAIRIYGKNSLEVDIIKQMLKEVNR